MTQLHYRLALLALALLGLGGCAGSWYVADADAEVAGILDPRLEALARDREAHVIEPALATEPEPEPTAERPSGPADETPVGVEPLVLDLAASLRIATEKNREFLSRRESLYLTGLGFALTRFSFGPQLNSTISYVWSDTEDATGNHAANASFGISQLLPTGGSLSFTSSVSGTWPEGGAASGANSFGTSTGVSLSQPLLRRAGYEVSHEGLVQSVRGLVYEVRDFELFREAFTIDIARSFFNLISQKRTLVNQELRFAQAVFDRKKSEALRSVDRNTDQEVFRAQREEITTQDGVIDAQASYERAVDEFKIQLGLATSRPVSIVDEDPPFEPVRVDPDSAVNAALHNRLDLMTQRDRLEDAERAVRISENALLPDLDLNASYDVGGAGGTFARAAPDDYAYSAGVSFTVPLQRKAERNAYRSSLISYEQSRRSLSLTVDRLELDIRDRIRRLQSTEKRIQLQGQQILEQKRAVTVTEIRYEAGLVDNRDLIEARQSLNDAQNQLIQLQVDHFIGRLELLRALGLLFIDEEGKWR